MAIEDGLYQLAKKVAQDVKNLRTQQGNLSNLNTSDKQSLVGAINELKETSNAGFSEVKISKNQYNILEIVEDGLYVKDPTIPDPLARYILAKT